MQMTISISIYCFQSSMITCLATEEYYNCFGNGCKLVTGKSPDLQKTCLNEFCLTHADKGNGHPYDAAADDNNIVMNLHEDTDDLSWHVFDLEFI